jgi:hypothetical protein
MLERGKQSGAKFAVVGSGRRCVGLGLGPGLTLVAPDGCAGRARRDCGLGAAQPQVNLAVRLFHPTTWVSHQVAARLAVKATGRRVFLPQTVIQ